MASLAPACLEAKKKYEECFNRWFSEKFVTGKSRTDECQDLFAAYRDCLWTEIKARGIDKMIDESRKDQPLAFAAADSGVDGGSG